MIEFRHIRKEFAGGSAPLKDINGVIEDGEVVGLIGPSGTGKSTLLRCINRLGPATSGEIIIDGEDINAAGYDECTLRKKAGMVFQHFNLFENMSVIQNIMQPQIDLLGKTKQEAYDTAIKLLKSVGMETKALRYPDVLSGGQKQRVAIARCLAMDPDIILLDEPISALDPSMVEEVKKVIYKLTETDKTMIVVSHDMDFIRTICTRVIYMDQGELYETGTPEEIFENPKRERTRAFIGRMKTLELDIHEDLTDYSEYYEQIRRFADANELETKTRRELEMICEELSSAILAPHYGSDIYLKILVKHAKEKNVTEVTAMYKGSAFNIEDTENDMALSIVKSVSENLEYSYDEERKYENVLRIRLK